MLEIHIDKRGEAAIENLADLMEQFGPEAERAINSALASEGYRLRDIMQRVMTGDNAGPVGHSWAKLNPHTPIIKRGSRRWLKNWKMVWRGVKGKKRRGRQYWEWKGAPTAEPLARFKGGLRYKLDTEQSLLSVGFVNASTGVTRLLKKQATGYSTPVTARLRRFFFALGFPLKRSTTSLETPARPLIEPIFMAEKDNIATELERKFFNSLAGYWRE